ncbi:GtrA family protein [Lelliottia sp. RWM.1]|nr:GtrA family protein [Lelliottia sp. RWM.1]
MVGLMNTVTTMLIIFILMHSGFSLYVANALGYIVGIMLSFVMNSRFTFSVDLKLARFLKFLVTVAISYGLNILTIKYTIYFLSFNEYISQFAGMVIYTVACFVINKLWAMK